MATRLLFCQSMRMILQSTLKDLLPEGGHRTASERMFRRVVVAAELSPAHERLLADMTELAARTGGKVTGVLAARPRSMDDALTHPWLERTRATQASAFVRPYWAGPDATSFDALIAYERENGADLVGVAAAPTSVWRRGFVDPDVRAACAVKFVTRLGRRTLSGLYDLIRSGSFDSCRGQPHVRKRSDREVRRYAGDGDIRPAVDRICVARGHGSIADRFSDEA